MAIVQARMGSTRLPGKSLKPLAGRPVVLQVVRRVAAAPGVDEVWVATSTSPADDPLAEAVQAAGVPVFRGSENDVLDRFHGAASAARAEAVVRITADCPLHDPAVIGHVVERFHEERPDYCSNIHPPTFPDGLDTEVVTRAALARAWSEAQLPSEREHVLPYVWTNPGKFRLVNVEHSRDLQGMRWVLDNDRDFAFVAAVYDALEREERIFGMEEVLELLRQRPELLELNRSQHRNEGYEKSLREDEAWKARRSRR